MPIRTMKEFQERMTKIGLIKEELDPDLPEHIARWFLVKGCTEEEIEAVRVAQNVHYLPPLYRQFLLQMGRKSGRIFSGCGAEYGYSDLLEMKNEAITDLSHYEKSGEFQLPDDAFVLYRFGDGGFHYFLTADENPNPAVYIYYNGKGQPTEWETLLDYYNSALEAAEQRAERERAERERQYPNVRRWTLDTGKKD